MRDIAPESGLGTTHFDSLASTARASADEDDSATEDALRAALAATLDGPLTYASDGGLGADLRRAGAAAPPHASLLLVGGHSAGNHVIVRRLTSFGCGRAGGVVLLDPVDVRIRRESNEPSSLRIPAFCLLSVRVIDSRSRAG